MSLTLQRNALEARIRTLETALASRAPAYWDYRAPQPLDVAALQAVSGGDAGLLRPNEAAVMVLSGVGPDRGLVFAVSKVGFAWAQISLTGDEIAARVARLRHQIDPLGGGRGIAASGSVQVDPSTFNRSAAHELYRAILSDHKVDRVINGPGIDTLIFAATGPLTSLPPSLLVVDVPAGSDRDPQALARTHWLIRDKALAVLPAISSLRTLRELLPSSRQSPDRPLLALADPDFSGDGVTPQAADPAVSRGSRVPPPQVFERDGRGSPQLADLPPLYGTLAEGRALASLLAPHDPDALLTGPAATKTSLLARNADRTLARVRVLSFSTHGLVTGDFTGLDEPALALAHPPKSGADPRDDGLLTASQAAALTLNADWVVLSACNTAAGDGGNAEGLSGLARGFFHAGASALLVSHWRVDDAATSKLIANTFRFYHGDRSASVARAADLDSADKSVQHPSKSEALRRAILEMLNETGGARAEPRFWAPFVVVGAPE